MTRSIVPAAETRRPAAVPPVNGLNSLHALRAACAAGSAVRPGTSPRTPNLTPRGGFRSLFCSPRGDYTGRGSAAELSTSRTEELLCTSRVTPRKARLTSSETHVLHAGLSVLHQILVKQSGVDVATLPKHAQGGPRLLARSFFERLLNGSVKLKSCMAADVSAAQLDIRLLTCLQWLQIRVHTLDFSHAETKCSTLSAHTNFLSQVDSRLYKGLARGFVLGEYIQKQQTEPCEQEDVEKVSASIQKWVEQERLPGDVELNALGILIIRVLGAVQLLDAKRQVHDKNGVAPGPSLPLCWMLQLDDQNWHGDGLALFHTKELWVKIIEGGSKEMVELCGGEQICVAADLAKFDQVQWDFAVFDPEQEGALERVLQQSTQTQMPASQRFKSICDDSAMQEERSTLNGPLTPRQGIGLGPSPRDLPTPRGQGLKSICDDKAMQEEQSTLNGPLTPRQGIGPGPSPRNLFTPRGEGPVMASLRLGSPFTAKREEPTPRSVTFADTSEVAFKTRGKTPAPAPIQPPEGFDPVPEVETPSERSECYSPGSPGSPLVGDEDVSAQVPRLSTPRGLGGHGGVWAFDGRGACTATRIATSAGSACAPEPSGATAPRAPATWDTPAGEEGVAPQEHVESDMDDEDSSDDSSSDDSSEDVAPIESPPSSVHCASQMLRACPLAFPSAAEEETIVLTSNEVDAASSVPEHTIVLPSNEVDAASSVPEHTIVLPSNEVDAASSVPEDTIVLPSNEVDAASSASLTTPTSHTQAPKSKLGLAEAAKEFRDRELAVTTPTDTTKNKSSIDEAEVFEQEVRDLRARRKALSVRFEGSDGKKVLRGGPTPRKGASVRDSANTALDIDCNRDDDSDSEIEMPIAAVLLENTSQKPVVPMSPMEAVKQALLEPRRKAKKDIRTPIPREVAEPGACCGARGFEPQCVVT